MITRDGWGISREMHDTENHFVYIHEMVFLMSLCYNSLTIKHEVWLQKTRARCHPKKREACVAALYKQLSEVIAKETRNRPSQYGAKE